MLAIRDRACLDRGKSRGSDGHDVMSEEHKPAEDEPQSTVLHMGKFAPKAPTDPPSTTTADESPTLTIARAAAQTAETSREPVVVPKGVGHSVPPEKMLGAVSYAYAKGVYSSEDIERKMATDPKFRAALGDDVPDAQTIRRFRRLNREAILKTLEKFFRWKRKKDKASTVAPATPTPAAPAVPTGEESPTVLMGRKEAGQCLDNAVIVDNLSREDVS